MIVKVTDGRAHSDCGWKGYHREHILVAEKMLGRLLARGEVVHHVDGDRANNKEGDTGNLWVSTHAGHKRAHQSLQEIGYKLVRKGLIAFDRTTGKYIITDERLIELMEAPK